MAAGTSEPSWIGGEKQPSKEELRRLCASPHFDIPRFLEDQLEEVFQASQKPSTLTFDPKLGSENTYRDSETLLMEMLGDLDDTIQDASAAIEQDLKELEGRIAMHSSNLTLELGRYETGLDDVSGKLESLSSLFSSASAEAMKVGEKLGVSETQRSQVQDAIFIMETIMELQNLPQGFLGLSEECSPENVRELLPLSLRRANWEEVTRRLYEVRRVLQDAKLEDFENAQDNIYRISQIVEAEFLIQFQGLLGRILETSATKAQLRELRSIAQSLMYFEHGRSIQELFLSTVIHARIRNQKISESEGTIPNRMEGGDMDMLSEVYILNIFFSWYKRIINIIIEGFAPHSFSTPLPLSVESNFQLPWLLSTTPRRCVFVGS